MPLGDSIEQFTTRLGIPSCGACQKRKQLLNGNGNWTNKKPWEAPAGWSLIKRWDGENRSVAMFRHESGKRIIWTVKDGKYASSSSYCCDSLGEQAEKRYADLCR